MGAARIEQRFAALKREGRAGLIAFITAGDPNLALSRTILERLPKAGADVIELGMPFSDPMADGPAIQASSLRALNSGMTLQKTLDLVSEFRKTDQATPIILMGYCNPIFTYGAQRFAEAANRAGVDGLIIVDLPPEEEAELKPFTDAVGLAMIRLVAPTTDEARLKRVTAGTSGFVYFISITGVTGTKELNLSAIEPRLASLRQACALPVAVGFGIKTPARAAEVARVADGVVVGSAIVEAVAGLDARASHTDVQPVLDFVHGLSQAVRTARVKVNISS